MSESSSVQRGKRVALGIIVGTVCFILILFWCLFVWVAFTLAEAESWQTISAFIVPTLIWGFICFLLGRGVALHRRRETIVAGSLASGVVLLVIISYVLHVTMRWPF